MSRCHALCEECLDSPLHFLIKVGMVEVRVGKIVDERSSIMSSVDFGDLTMMLVGNTCSLVILFLFLA